MGGMGSGRRDGAPTKEAMGTIVIDVHQLLRWAKGATGWAGALTITGAAAEPQRIAMRLDLDRDQGLGSLRLVFDIQHFSRRTGPQDQVIALRSIPCHFGGRRWTFICPVRRCRATRLYLPNGGSIFAGRRAYRIAYQSQRGTREDRAWGVIRRVDARLGYDGEGDWIPKPKWMRWKTFNRLCDRRDAAEAVLDEALFAAGERMLRRHSP